MFPRNDRRWATPFGRWVARTGVSRIVEGLSSDPETRITRGTVYQWLQGHGPHPSRALALVSLSRGRLSLEEILKHRIQIQKREARGGR